MLSALFHTTTAPPPLPRERAKRYRPRESDEVRAMKKECTELESARRASLVDEEDWQMRSRELASGASSFRLETVERSTTEGADIATDTTMMSLLLMERFLSNWTRQLVNRRRYAPQVCFTYHLVLYFLCIRTISCFLIAGG